MHFSVLSYLDEVTVAAIVDPDQFGDLDVLVRALTHQLNNLG